MLKALVTYSVLFTLVTTQAAWAAESARGGAKRSPAQEAQQAAIAAIDVDGQRAQLANAGKSLEALGIGFSTVPAAAGAASETTHISDLLSSGQSAFRMSVPARAGVAAYGIQVQSTAVASGAHRVSIAAYDVGFSRRLGMQSVSFSPTDDSTQIRLRMERAAKTLANSVPCDSGHTNLLRKVYDAVVPSAEADVVGVIFMGLMFAIAACGALCAFSTVTSHNIDGANSFFVFSGLILSAAALVSAYRMIQEFNNPRTPDVL